MINTQTTQFLDNVACVEHYVIICNLTLQYHPLLPGGCTTFTACLLDSPSSSSSSSRKPPPVSTTLGGPLGLLGLEKDHFVCFSTYLLIYIYLSVCFSIYTFYFLLL